MIGFVTWPPFSYLNYYKGGQVTNPIIFMKICYKLIQDGNKTDLEICNLAIFSKWSQCSDSTSTNVAEFVKWP